MSTKTSSQVPVFVVGADLDRALVRRLTHGDHVLVEMNGSRLLANSSNPLISKQRWTVISNSLQEIVLRHPSIRHDLSLPYKRLQNSTPAVFLIDDPFFKDGALYVVLQFISHVSPSGDVAEAYQPGFDVNTLLDTTSRDEVLKSFQSALATFSQRGWNYKSVCRFALRSGVRAKIIEAFRVGDWETISAQGDLVIKRIALELAWMPHFLAQNCPDLEAEAARRPHESH